MARICIVQGHPSGGGHFCHALADAYCWANHGARARLSQNSGNMQVRTLRRRYSSSWKPYAALDHADIRVQPLNEPQAYLVLGLAIGGDGRDVLRELACVPQMAAAEKYEKFAPMIDEHSDGSILADADVIERLPKCCITWNLSNKIAACGASSCFSIPAIRPISVRIPAAVTTARPRP